MYFMWEEVLYHAESIDTLKFKMDAIFKMTAPNNFLMHCCIPSVFRLTELSTYVSIMCMTCENSSTDSEQDMEVFWAAFHASKIQPTDINSPIDISVLLPLFDDDSKSPAMIKHAMNIIKDSVVFLNPGQVPLFAVAKIIQWNVPQTHREN